MKKYAPIILVIGLFFLECKNVFLDKTAVSLLKYPEVRQNLVIYFDKSFIVSEAGRLIIKTHSLLKIGKDLKTAPELFSVFDGSVEKLIDFQARITHFNGASKAYHKKDLLLENLSNKQTISELKLRFLPIKEACRIGDVVEILCTHEMTLPPLGIRFSPAEIGHEAVNVSCSIQIPAQDSLSFRVVNDDLSPQINVSENSKIYLFKWSQYFPSVQKNVFEKKNRDPQILASLSRCKTSYSTRMIAILNWKDFGDWYLELIAPKIRIDEQISRLAREITHDIKTDKEKMDAIFDYCQKNIRYEQVYIEKGELIPTEVNTVLARKYGDCKDYSAAIYGLAESIGLHPHLALCYRGRGYEFYCHMPVSQFNHMIVYFEDNGKNYWYDATNRTGLPGLTTIDLLNQTALIVEKNNSRLLTIAEFPENKLLIDGLLKYINKSLVGEFKISLAAQYAIDLFYAEMYANRADFLKMLVNWMEENLNKDIIISALKYQKEDRCFIIQAKCELPNTVLEIEQYKYLSLIRIFNRLFPDKDQKINPDRIFYFPYYNRVGINLHFTNLHEPGDFFAQQEFFWRCEYSIPAGSFDGNQKAEFLSKFESISTELYKTVKLIEREASL